jgi:hypothetical protein
LWLGWLNSGFLTFRTTPGNAPAIDGCVISRLFSS